LDGLLPPINDAARHDFSGGGTRAGNQNGIARLAAQSSYIGGIEARHTAPDLETLDNGEL